MAFTSLNPTPDSTQTSKTLLQQNQASVMLSTQKAEKSFICSGALIRTDVVLTAAHCLEDAEQIRVTNENAIQEHTEFVNASEWRMHPDYRGNNLNGVDLGLVRLERPILVSEFFIPTALPREQLKQNAIERIGYGLRDGMNRRNVFEENSIKYFVNQHYLQTYDEHGYEGDSGGPVFVRHDQKLWLVGVHSGRKQNAAGQLENFSNALALNPDLVRWIAEIISGWK